METEQESRRIIDIARQYVTDNQDVLRRAYGGKYIAVKSGVILGCSENGDKLAKEIDENFRNFSVLIGTIDDIVNQRGDYIEVEK